MTEQVQLNTDTPAEIPPTELEPASKRLSGRRDTMREIANTARKSREDGLSEEDKLIVKPPAEEAPPAEVLAETPPVEPPPVETPPVEAPELIAFAVDGVERKVTVAEAQEMLADKARGDAELAAQAKRRQELEEMEALTPKAPDLLPLAQEAVSAILDSTEEEAAQKLVTVLDNLRPEPQTIDTEAMIEKAADRAAEKVQVLSARESREMAIAQFEVDRKDIFADKFMLASFDIAATEYHNEHPEAAPIEVLTAAAESVDNWKSKFEAPPPADKEFAEKEARKARATENVSTISERRPTPPDKPPPTRSEIIAQKQQKRGRISY